jgi:hypothetical protein
MAEHQDKPSSSPIQLGEELWDEITKSIASKMPEEFLPLIKEEFGKEYPAGLERQTASFVDSFHATPLRTAGQK